MGKDKFIPIIAIILLLIGISSTIYVHANFVDKSTITINGDEYTIEEINSLANLKTIQTNEGEVVGVSLEDLLSKIGNACLSCSEFTVKAKDGYEKTINWDILKTGVLTKENRVVFPNTSKSLWVRDVVEIEVK